MQIAAVSTRSLQDLSHLPDRRQITSILRCGAAGKMGEITPVIFRCSSMVPSSDDTQPGPTPPQAGAQPTPPPASQASSQTSNEQRPNDSLLGVSTADLAGLTVAKLLRNETAITMLLHYYRELLDESNSLKNDVNFYREYQRAYSAQQSWSKTAAALTLLGNVLVGFGVNLMTGGAVPTGVVVFIPGIVVSGASIWFSLRKD